MLKQKYRQRKFIRKDVKIGLALIEIKTPKTWSEKDIKTVEKKTKIKIWRWKLKKRSEMKMLVQMRGEKDAANVTSANDDGPRNERSCYAYEYYEH